MPPFAVAPMSPVVVTASSTIAGFWWRVMAYVIDLIILAIVVLLPLRATNVSFYAESFIQVVASFLYFGLFIGYSGQTPGMRLFRMRCVSTDGSRVTPSQAFTRAGVYCVLLLIASLYQYHAYTNPTVAQRNKEAREAGIYLLLALPHIIDLLWAAWDKQRQTLHDKAGGTVVIRVARP